MDSPGGMGVNGLTPWPPLLKERGKKEQTNKILASPLSRERGGKRTHRQINMNP